MRYVLGTTLMGCLCLACADPQAPPPGGTVEVRAATTGSGFHPSGYDVRVDGVPVGAVLPNGTLLLERLTPGAHTVELSGLESNCTLTSGGRHEIVVVERQTVPIAVEVRCEARILFRSDRSGNPDVWVVDADGTGMRQLTQSLAADMGPSWSPNYDVVLFYSQRDGNFEVYAMGADGRGQRNLTRHPDDDVLPASAPDGAHIAYASHGASRALATDQIFLMNVDGTGQERVSLAAASGVDPSFSPDSRSIVFVSGRDGNPEIYAIGADGSGARNLTKHAQSDGTPAWSPDGSRIAFSTFRDGNWEIYVMHADGSSPVNLSRAPDSAEGQPAWSPDGTRIVFVSNRTGRRTLWMMAADGSDVRQLTTGGEDVEPAWSR